MEQQLSQELVLGAFSDTVTRHWNILVLFHLAAKLQYIRFFMEGTCNLGSGKSSKSQLEMSEMMKPSRFHSGNCGPVGS